MAGWMAEWPSTTLLSPLQPVAPVALLAPPLAVWPSTHLSAPGLGRSWLGGQAPFAALPRWLLPKNLQTQV
jgi:hypothetical protein